MVWRIWTADCIAFSFHLSLHLCKCSKLMGLCTVWWCVAQGESCGAGDLDLV